MVLDVMILAVIMITIIMVLIQGKNFEENAFLPETEWSERKEAKIVSSLNLFKCDEEKVSFVENST